MLRSVSASLAMSCMPLLSMGQRGLFIPATAGLILEPHALLFFSTVVFTPLIALMQADGLSARLTAMDERLRVLAAQPAPLPDIQPQLQVAWMCL